MTERELLIVKIEAMRDRLDEMGIPVAVPDTEDAGELFKFARQLMEAVKGFAKSA